MQDVAEHDVMPAGLSDAEAAARLAAEGFNEIARQRKRTALRIALDVLREPMFLFLIGSGII